MARASPRAGVAPSCSQHWGPRGSCLPLLSCQPVPGTAKGLVLLLELLGYHGVASTAQHSTASMAQPGEKVSLGDSRQIFSPHHTRPWRIQHPAAP